MRENIRTTRLSSGLTIISDPMAGVRSVTLGFFYRVGSRHETAGIEGITHFIEHSVFKGTKKLSALEIAVEQDRLGGTLDAFTTHEETGFVIKVIDDELENAFRLLADMLTDPLFDEAELKNEQSVIIEEMKMVEDSPEDLLNDIFSSEFFPHHPLGKNIVGTPKSVRTFDHLRTSAYHSRAFSPANLVIAAAGNVAHAQLEDLTSQYLGDVPENSEAISTEVSGPVTAAPIVIRQNKNLEQAHLMIALPFVSATDERRYAADLLANIIGGGNSSRLWQKVREEKGLAYSVGAGTVMFRDCGYFSVFAATSPDQAGEVIDISVDELRKVVRHGVSSDEIDLTKQQARASILLSLEDSAARAGAIANSEMTYGRQISVEETLSKIAEVSAENATELAIELFRNAPAAFAALGDLKDLKVDRDRISF